MQEINTSQVEKSLFLIWIYLACRYESIDAVKEHAQQAKIETCKPLAEVGLHDGIFMYFDHTLCTPGKPLTCSVA